MDKWEDFVLGAFSVATVVFFFSVAAGAAACAVQVWQEVFR